MHKKGFGFVDLSLSRARVHGMRAEFCDKAFSLAESEEGGIT